MTLLRKQRIFYILLIFIVILGLYVLRLAWIQSSFVFKSVSTGGRSMNELAVRQREAGVELDTGRGHFVDRTGKRFTGEIRWLPIFYPVDDIPEEKELSKLANLLGTTPKQLHRTWSTLKEPYIWTKTAQGTETRWSESEAKEWTGIHGLEVLPYVSRYFNGESGRQWLGYISERPDVIRKLRDQHKNLFPLSMQIGASGLERTFDFLLRSRVGTRAYYMVDAKRKGVPGTGIHIKASNNPYYPLQIQTTISDHLQQRIERLTEEMHIVEGAIVVLDVKQGDVVAMVSRPFFDPVDVRIDSGDWSNRAVKAAIPGSIFKTVIAAAALEEKVTSPNEVFHCTGHYGKYGLACWKKEGHGSITLPAAFAQSCNVVFAELGERLTASQITQTAHKLGLGRTIGWQEKNFMDVQDLKQFDQEEAGYVFRGNNAIDGGVLAQTALGQRDVLVSPLQAANLIVTLLHKGQVSSPRVVSTIKFKDGSTFVDLPIHKISSPYGQLSAKTCDTLLSWMGHVVRDGTGRSLQKAKWELAGKSGTAEVLKEGRSLNNQWFIGYGPMENPKYAVAVLVQNRKPNSPHLGIELFRKTMDILAANPG